MEQKLVPIFNNILKKKNKPVMNSLDPNLLLRDDLGFDSLDLAELTVRIEDQFGVDIFEDGFVTSVEEIIDKLK